MMVEIAQLIGGDIYDAIDAVLSYIENQGWQWKKPEGYHGAVIDNQGEYHLLHMAHTFSDAVADAFRLLKQFEAHGWVNKCLKIH